MSAAKRKVDPVTIKHVAEHLGVAVSSVSRVLNNHPYVSESMKRRVMDAAEQLGYRPDHLAQSLRRGASQTIGFLLRDLSNPIFADIVKGAETRLREGRLLPAADPLRGGPEVRCREPALTSASVESMDSCCPCSLSLKRPS